MEQDSKPLRRQRRRIDAVGLKETVDNSDEAFTEDQLANRFNAEWQAQLANNVAECSDFQIKHRVAAMTERKRRARSPQSVRLSSD